MARLLVVVLVLVAIAMLANKYLLHGGDPMPAEPAGAPAAEAKDKPGADAATLISPAPAPTTNITSRKPGAGPTEKDEAAVKASAKAEVAEAAPAAEVKTDVNPQAAAVAGVVAAPTTPARTQDRADLPEEPIALLDPSLTAGIPGDGKLTTNQVDAWLADPKSHVVLKPELPAGLAAGQAEIKGIDENPLTRAKIELGRQLYFDQRLSSDASISCASCHDPDTGYASASRFGLGVRKQQGNRNSPVAYNRILSGPQFWDGRAASLEEQAKGPIANPIEMANTHETCVVTLKKIPGYVKQFDAIFKDGLTIGNAAKAMACFERALVTGPAPWDVYLELKKFKDSYASDIEDLDALKKDDPELYGKYMKVKQAADDEPISESAIRGGELFFGDKAGCTACHNGANFTDEKYHNLGVGMDADQPDLGRYEVTKIDKDRGAFKTPTVRNVAATAPYMHDGSQKTLEEVVEWYAKGGHPNQWLDEKVKKLDLSDQDKKDLVAFLQEGMTGKMPKVSRTRLPADPEAAAENRQQNAAAKEN